MAARGTIFWDFDGTLIHARAMWRMAFLEAIRAHAPQRTDLSLESFGPHLNSGFPWHTPEIPHHELNDPRAWWAFLEKKFANVFEVLGFDAAEAFSLAKATHANVVRPEVYVPFPGVVEVLKELRAKGWRHIVLSNHAPELPQIMEALGLASHFEQILVSATLGYDKPHPEIFALAKRAAAETGPLWMVGDNIVADIQGAEQAGIPAILVHQPKHSHVRQAADLGQVAAIIEGQAAPTLGI
jgi:putative hydrolase of the HAD superfamily